MSDIKDDIVTGGERTDTWEVEYCKAADKVRRLEEQAGQGEKILHAIRQAVKLEFSNGVSLLKFIEKRWITDEMIDLAVKMIYTWKTEDPVYTDYESGWEVLNRFNIYRCEECRGIGRDDVPPIVFFCDHCDGHGWTISKINGTD